MDFNLTGAGFGARSQVGLAQRTDLMQRVKKTEDIHPREEPKPVETKEKRPEDRFTPTEADDRPKIHQRKAEQVIKRFMPETGLGVKAQKTNEKDTKQALIKQQDVDEAKAKVPLDNASRIGLMYQQAQRKKNAEQGPLNNDRPAQSQQGQLKNFLGNLRKFVKTEYDQYTKTEISTYNRRNLREILGALGDNVKTFDDKAAKDRRDRQVNGDVKKAYNKHYAATASKNLKLFNEDPMQDPNYSALELTA
jgi:hypothetical protein